MTAIDSKAATIAALTKVFQDSLSKPHNAEDLQKIFGMGYRATRNLVGQLDGVERVGCFYRIPIRHMPADYIAAFLPILANSCASQNQPPQIGETN